MTLRPLSVCALGVFALAGCSSNEAGFGIVSDLWETPANADAASYCHTFSDNFSGAEFTEFTMLSVRSEQGEYGYVYAVDWGPNNEANGAPDRECVLYDDVNGFVRLDVDAEEQQSCVESIHALAAELGLRCQTL